MDSAGKWRRVNKSILCAGPTRLVATEREALHLKALATDVTASTHDPIEIVESVRHLIDQVPSSLSSSIINAATEAEVPAIHLKNLPVEAVAMPPTPVDRPAPVPYITALFSFIACALGEPYAFARQQSGSIVNDVAPSPKALETGHINSGSRLPFPFHTEDAFHPCLPDYVLLICLRNSDQIPTRISAPTAPIPERMWDLLSRPVFTHQASPSHAGGAITPYPAPILFGSRAAPNIRINYGSLVTTDLSAETRHALDELAEMLDENSVDVNLEVGDCLIIDNLRVVHGRESFRARFDGADRWLKRTIVMRDLRRASLWCDSSRGRILCDR